MENKKLNYINDKLKDAAIKINSALPSLRAKNRDEQGVAFSTNRIITGVQNFLYGADNSTMFNVLGATLEGSTNFSTNRGSMNFSTGAGLNDTAGAFNVDLVDISIGATLKSDALTYIAAERAMDTNVQNIQFLNLVAMNDAGGFKKGDVVYDVRSAINNKVDLGQTSAISSDLSKDDSSTAESLVIKAGAAIIPGKVTLKDEDGNIVGTDPLRDGVIYFSNLTGKVAGKVVSGSVKYDTGDITVTCTSGGDTDLLKAVVVFDRSSSTEGVGTLRLKQVSDNYTLVSTENRIVLETSIEATAEMNKLFMKQIAAGIDLDITSRAVENLIEIYSFYIDCMVVKELVATVLASGNITKTDDSKDYLDLSGYTITSQLLAKDNLVLNHINKLNSDLLNRTGRGPSCYVVNTSMAILLSTTSGFTASPEFNTRRDGYIGDLRGIPVVRHTVLDDKFVVDIDGTPTTIGGIIANYKSTNGMASSVFFGEFLAPYSNTPAVNFNNPGQLAQALFSQTAVKGIAPQWAQYAMIRPF